MTNHDSAYHGLFSHPELVRDLIAHFIPEPWVAQLDLDSLERVNAKFHAEELTRREGDLIYRLRWKDSGEPVYVFFLDELAAARLYRVAVSASGAGKAAHAPRVAAAGISPGTL